MKKVLIVDDSISVRKALERILKPKGVEVLSADSAKVALDILEHQNPTLIIADIVMPEMDGYEFCGVLKQDDRLKTIPVLLISGIVNPEVKSKAKEVKSIGIVKKPFKPDTLLYIVSLIFDKLDTQASAAKPAPQQTQAAPTQVTPEPSAATEDPKVTSLPLAERQTSLDSNHDSIQTPLQASVQSTVSIMPEMAASPPQVESIESAGVESNLNASIEFETTEFNIPKFDNSELATPELATPESNTLQENLMELNTPDVKPLEHNPILDDLAKASLPSTPVTPSTMTAMTGMESGIQSSIHLQQPGSYDSTVLQAAAQRFLDNVKAGNLWLFDNDAKCLLHLGSDRASGADLGQYFDTFHRTARDFAAMKSNSAMDSLIVEYPEACYLMIEANKDILMVLDFQDISGLSMVRFMIRKELPTLVAEIEGVPA